MFYQTLFVSSSVGSADAGSCSPISSHHTGKCCCEDVSCCYHHHHKEEVLATLSNMSKNVQRMCFHILYIMSSLGFSLNYHANYYSVCRSIGVGVSVAGRKRAAPSMRLSKPPVFTTDERGYNSYAHLPRHGQAVRKKGE